jgi:glyoxylase-like metal-dependent hydrolase (beta-lactamase superfamily II)
VVVDTPGKVTDRIFLLGRKESCVYLLKGKEAYTILGGGMAYMVPEVVAQLKDFAIAEQKIKRIVIHHAHFDHCGVVPFFKRRWPWAKITASARAKALLSDPLVVERIAQFNQMLIAEHGREKQSEELGLGFSGIDVEVVVKDGDILHCDDLSMEVIEVPGHSSCSIAVYVAREKAMFGSDSGGIPFGSHIFTAANSNFDKYQKSLERMARYDIHVYLAEHFGARIGTDARCYLEKSKDAAAETRELLMASYGRTRDVEKSTEEVTEKLMARVPEGFMPRDIIAIVAGQMLRFIARQMGTAP